MKIYDSTGIEILDIQVDDTSVRNRSIMSDDSLTLNFSAISPVVIPRGAYVDFEGARYTLFYPENFKKNNTRDFAYTLTLHGYREALKLYKYKDLSAKPYRLKFPLTAHPVDFLQLLVDCMNLHDSGWSVGDCIETDEKLISFNHEYCFDVLCRFAEEFNTEWEIAGKTIHLRKVEKFKDDPLPLSYGMGNGFKTGVGRQNDGDRQPAGLLYVQGGERNIDYSEYGSTTLLLPKSATLVYEGKTYRTDPDGMYITRDGNTNVAEDSYDGSSHYPKRVGSVSHVIIVDADQHFYDIRDTSIPAALNFRDCRIPGEKAIIVFQSGALAGREFNIEQTDTDLTGYIHTERRFKIVPAELDGQIMPGGVFVPQVGDKYAIFNIRMPDAYISDNATQSGASWDMLREAVAYFAEEENDKFSFNGELDGVWSRPRWLEIGGKIVPGGHVLFSDPQFQPTGILIRIVSIKDYVNKPHKPEITLSNAPISGSFSAGLGKLEAEEVMRDADKKEMIRFTKRQYRDAKETMAMLENALLNFSGSINPLTVQTMQLLVGDESLQFRFVNSKSNPQPVTHNVAFNSTTKVLTASAGILQHMTLGITTIKNSHTASEYKYWDIAAYTSPALEADKAYYLYSRCGVSGTTGIFLLSETFIGMESVANQYHFLLGILNSEQEGDRSFAPLYGYSEILPGRITTDRIVSQDGKTYFDLLAGIIGGKIKFQYSGNETDLSSWAENIKAGNYNLLRNTGFLGDFLPLRVDEMTLVTENTPIGTNPLVHWVHDGVKVIDVDSHSGKGVRIGDLQQTIKLVAGETYKLSFKAKGSGLNVSLVDSSNVELTEEYEKYAFVVVSTETKTYTFRLYDASNSAEVCEIMLSAGNIDVDYSYAVEDDIKEVTQLQAINSILSSIKDYDTGILGGLILTSMLQLGKYKDGKMEKVNAGISGLYNNDDDPAIWLGGSLDKAIRTVQRLKENPYSVTEEEWKDLANIVFTHGGDGFFRGIIHALGGLFRGRVESNADGNRIVIDPEDRSIKGIGANGNIQFRIMFTPDTGAGTGSYMELNTYKSDGSILVKLTLSPLGLTMQGYGTPMTRAEYFGDRFSIRQYTEDANQNLVTLMDMSLSYNSIGGFVDFVIEGLPETGNGLPANRIYKSGGILRIT